MTTSNSTRERRDWTLLIFFIPIGIIFMLVAGQVAIRLVPIWSIEAGMQSNLDPNNLPMQQSGPVQPVLPAILTPLGWLDTFLTPNSDTGDDVVFPPIIIFKPTITPLVTTPPPTVTVVVTPSPTIIPATTSPTVVLTPTPTSTKKPPTNTPTNTPTSTPTNTPTPAPTGTPPVGVSITPPTELGVNVPPNGTPAALLPGEYTVIPITSSPLVVSTTPDGYDLIFYEYIDPINPGSIYLDQIIIGISQNANGSDYYVVFNWGDNIPNTNTNVDTATLPPDNSPSCLLFGPPECDNRVIPTADLHDADGDLTTPDGDLTTPQTGILIDVDTAPSPPPEGTYNYIVIISPISGAPDPAQIDSVVVIP